MNLLLDTHIFLWYIFGVSKLKVLDKEIIENSENQVFISDYSIWEIMIKSKLGKLSIPSPTYTFLIQEINNHEFSICSNRTSAFQYLENLPDLHNDPFDRMLISQSIDLGYTLVTEDSNIMKYKNKVELLKIL
jgi:PIN domain nuclease of toxin-antitoxin system